MIAWFNAELLPLAGIAIKATDRGFLLGDGFFETLAANNAHIAQFDAHMDRLEKTAHFMSLPVPYGHHELKQAMEDVLFANRLTEKRAALRLSVSRGSGPRGLVPPLEISPQVLISASEVPDHFPCAKVATVSIRRNETSPVCKIKSLSYLDNIFAMQEAVAKGADEALLLNTQGHIAEGSISNIFFIQKDRLLTPRLEDGCLPGVMRACVLEAAKKLGMPIKETSLSQEILESCEEAFLTNSLVRIRPIHEIDGRLMPSQQWADRLLRAIKEAERGYL